MAGPRPFLHQRRFVGIGLNVWIGGGAIICPGVSIGDNSTIGAGSVIGAGAVITKHVAPGSVMKGIPAELSPVPSHRLKAI